MKERYIIMSDYPENRENALETENGNDLELRYLRKLNEAMSLEIDVGYSTTDQCVYCLQNELHRHHYSQAAEQYIEGRIKDFTENAGKRLIDAYLEHMKDGGEIIDPEDTPQYSRLQQLWGELKELEKELNAREHAILSIRNAAADNQADAHAQQAKNEEETGSGHSYYYFRLQRLWEEIQLVKEGLGYWTDAHTPAYCHIDYGVIENHKREIFSKPFWEKEVSNHPLVKLLEDADELQYMRGFCDSLAEDNEQLYYQMQSLLARNEALKKTLQTVCEYYTNPYATRGVAEIVMSHLTSVDNPRTPFLSPYHNPQQG